MKTLSLLSLLFFLITNTIIAQTPHTPDGVYKMEATSFEQEFKEFIQKNFILGDIVTVQRRGDQMVVKMYKEFAGFWWQHYGEGSRKEEICVNQNTAGFITCIKDQAAKGRVAIWKDREGNYHAE